MSDRQKAEQAYKKVISTIFSNDRNPTYALSQKALENITSCGEVFLMEQYRFIKYVGNNSNGNATFQVRF